MLSIIEFYDNTVLLWFTSDHPVDQIAAVEGVATSSLVYNFSDPALTSPC